ncbi:MAG: SBBP repeat-containing protein, partial [Bryobacteraceae bacterium]
ISTDMPVTANAAQTKFGGETDAILTVFDITKPPAQQLVYSTYLGGSNPDVALDLAEDAVGGIYLVGYTQSTDFPATAGAMQSNYGGGGADAFLARIDPTLASGTLTYGTYIGGPGYSIAYGIAVDGSGNLYLAGSTTTTVLGDLNGGLRVAAAGGADVFLLKIRPDQATPAESARLRRAADRGLPRR